MPTLLFVDDEIVDHDPGEFPDSYRTNSMSSGAFKANEPLGQIGHFIRDLEEVGLDVITATGVEEALTCLQQESARIDVVALDIMMPYLDGGLYDDDRTAGGMRTGFVLAEEIHSKYLSIAIWLLSQILPGEKSLVNRATVDDLVSGEKS